MKTGLGNRSAVAIVASVIVLFAALGGPSPAASQLSSQQVVDNDIRSQAVQAGLAASANELTSSLASADLRVLFNVNYCDGPALVTQTHTAYPGSAPTNLHNLRASSSLPAC